MVFARLTEPAVVALERRGFLFYRVERDIRLVCRHDQDAASIDVLVDAVRDAIAAG